ncbi:DUF6188 family protein [Nocardioides sp. DS6]|uniref:DUF6188 family protein n=1 Tax=Nocardioides eburneus TaxID=3231482 RepID=A0ABV3T2Y0_9ACTN
MIPDFAGQTIDIARIDWGLHFWTSENWEFVIECPIVVSVQRDDGVEQSAFDPAVSERPLPPELEPIVGARIDQVLVSGAGDLSIQLPGLHLTVPATEMYEAWHVIGKRGEMFICSPGGELMHFPPLAETSAQDDEAPGEET